MSDLSATTVCDLIEAGFTLLSLVHEVTTPVVKIAKAMMMIFFILCIEILGLYIFILIEWILHVLVSRRYPCPIYRQQPFVI